jgi:hypothetical protein
MISTRSCRPDHSLILITDKDQSEVPLTMGDELVAFTDTCIAVGTRPAPDGESLITLSDVAGLQGEPKGGHFIVFNGELKLSSGCLLVETPNGLPLFEMPTPEKQLHLLIWVNDEDEPDSIWIQVVSNS